MRGVHLSSKIMAPFMFVALLFTGTAGYAAEPDSKVTGLWLTVKDFPGGGKKAEVLEFTDDREMGTVTYKRSLDDGLLTFEIRRQKIKDSELQGPGDVEALIEMRVNNEDLSEDIIEENVSRINVEAESEGASQLFAYPCSTAEYQTGANEDVRKNAALFIFTDEYSFEVLISMAADSVGDYADAAGEWITGLKLAENSPGAAGEKNLGDKGTEIKGLWLEIPNIPRELTSQTNVDENGTIIYRVEIDNGLSLTIARLPNPDNALNNEHAGQIFARYTGLGEDDIDLTISEPDENFPLPIAHKYPFAAGDYSTGDGEEIIRNMDMLFFPDAYIFLLHIEIKGDEVLDKHGEDLTEWLQNMTFVER